MSSQPIPAFPAPAPSQPVDATATLPAPFETRAADGYPIRGFIWRAPEHAAHGARPQAKPRVVVVVNAATSVRCRYYFRFADYLFRHGFDVVVYDYRGIGESRQASLRGFDASWTDWGALDFEAVLQQVRQDFPGQPIDVVGHSFGGSGVGLAASTGLIRRVVAVGAQFAYWRDYALRQRLQMLVRWHLVMPLITALYGYFPGQRLGWLEDTPKGVVWDWVRSTPRFEDRPSARRRFGRDGAKTFHGLTAPMLAISTTDDPFGTVVATERLLAYYAASDRTHLRIAPAEVGAVAIGHFAFFHRRFESTLWPIALAWLQTGALPADTPGQVVAQNAAQSAPARS